MWPFLSFVYISVIQIWDFTFSLETWIQSLSYILDWTYLSCCYLVYITPRRSFHHNRYLSRPRGLGSFSYTAVKERFLSFEHFLLHKHIQIVLHVTTYEVLIKLRGNLTKAFILSQLLWVISCREKTVHKVSHLRSLILRRE